MKLSLLGFLAPLSQVPLADRTAPGNVVTTDPGAASGNTYDYIVVGGGLTGLVVAARLAEDSTNTVLVIEAGRDDRGDGRVYDIHRYGEVFNSDLLWGWSVDNWEAGKGMVGGKTLGGGSSINGGAYTRGLAAQYDAWSSLLTPGEQNLNWNWDSMFNYMKKAETFSPPNSEQASKGAQSVDSYHGSWGPVQVTFPNRMYGGPQQSAVVQTIQKTHNVGLCPDLNGGAPNCVAYNPFTIDWHRNDHRSSSAEAYLTPVQTQRPGWTILVQQQVTKILFQNGSPARATGVQFGRSDGTRYTANARKEVILAAGAINTPALMQLSGIGDAAKLAALGIKPVVDLPTVGKNLQEQTMNSLGAKGNGFDRGGDGPSNVIAYPNLYQAFGSQGATVASEIQSKIGIWARSQAANGGSAAALQKIFQIQADLITKKNAPILELCHDTYYPEGTELGFKVWSLLPFTRGSVGIQSTDPFVNPKINLNYFSVDFDLQSQIAGVRMARKILGTPPLSSLSTGEVVPGKSTVPDNGSGGTDADWIKWIVSTFNAVSHPVGTCAMMSRDLGGCVDGRLRVYGTQNLRVVDASAMPTQITSAKPIFLPETSQRHGSPQEYFGTLGSTREVSQRRYILASPITVTRALIS